MSDDELIAALVRGEDSALKEIFDRHSPWVAARLRRTLPVEAVEDVLQETFVAVWRGARSYKAEGELGAWIWGIARRQVAQWARKHNKPMPALELAVSEDPAPNAIRRLDLREALAALGPEGSEQRELVRLVLLEDRPLAEVSRMLGIPEGTVKSRMYRVRQRLQAVLRKGGYQE